MRRLTLLTAGVLVAGAFLLGFAMSRGDRATRPVPVSTVDEVREALAARYYLPVPEHVLRLGSVDAMLSALGDPYTAYLPQADYALLRHETDPSYSGIGIDVVSRPEGLLVVGTRAGPARSAGLRAGDTIVRIGGLPAAGLTPAQALARVSGPIGTRVQLRFLRAGRPHAVSVPRAVLRSSDVSARLLAFAGRTWGQLSVSAFAEGTTRELRADVRRLQRQGVAGFVLDLRGDPGGLLHEAVTTASLFLDGGVVVSLRGAHSPNRVYRARRGVTTKLPLVVLVDGGTASSAEVVASSLHDHHRAMVVGRHTYGKALVQSIDPLGDGGALELTIAHYYAAGGEDISGVGIVPDVRAADRPETTQDEALTAALQTLALPTS